MWNTLIASFEEDRRDFSTPSPVSTPNPWSPQESPLSDPQYQQKLLWNRKHDHDADGGTNREGFNEALVPNSPSFAHGHNSTSASSPRSSSALLRTLPRLITTDLSVSHLSENTKPVRPFDRDHPTIYHRPQSPHQQPSATSKNEINGATLSPPVQTLSPADAQLEEQAYTSQYTQSHSPKRRSPITRSNERSPTYPRTTTPSPRLSPRGPRELPSHSRSPSPNHISIPSAKALGKRRAIEYVDDCEPFFYICDLNATCSSLVL